MKQETYEALKKLIAKINASDSVYEDLCGKELSNVQNWIKEKENL